MLVGRNRHLCGVNAKVQVAACQIKRAQSFQIGIEFGARVTIRFGIPTHPIAGIQVHQILKGGGFENFVAHKLNLLDFGHVAFGHIEGQVDAIAFHRGDGGDDVNPIQAAIDVLALDVLFGQIGQ